MRAKFLGAMSCVALLAACGGPSKAPSGSKALHVYVLLAPSGRGDKSYNDAAMQGVEAAKRGGALEVAEIGGLKPEDAAAAIDAVADEADLIIAVGFLYADPVRSAAIRHKATRFLLLDAEVPKSANARSVTFRADDGSFLAGTAAGATTTSGKVAFLGGMQIPIIEKFECGFLGGTRWAATQRGTHVTTVSAFIGNTPSAFSDPAKGKQMAAAMLRSGADVLYHAAGASGSGAIDAAQAAGAKAIGVDTDQNYLAPATVVTSMRKRLDVAVEKAISDVRGGNFGGGPFEMNVANGGVDLVLPGRLTPDAVKLVERARQGLVTGQLRACG